MGPGVPVIWEQWNNGFINFFRGLILSENTNIGTHVPYHCLLLVPATGANILGLGTQKTRAPLSPGRSSFLKFPAKADLIPRSGQLEVPYIGYVYSEIPVIYASPSPNLPE